MDVPNTTIRLAIAQAVFNKQPLMIFFYGKTFVIAHKYHTLPDNAIKLAEITESGEYSDCQSREPQD